MSVQNEAIHTYARIKPLFMGEEKVFFKKNICTVATKNQYQFEFDGVFDAESTNQQVYKQSTQKIIEHSLQGYNSCVMAYGQTSSGKTYTMKGTQSNPGIIPLCLKDIFNRISQQKIGVSIKISYIEIYNEEIIDLLSQRDNCIIEPRQDQKKNLTLTGLTEFDVDNMSQAMNYFRKGEDKRKFASNNLNVNSSRSHAIFRINLKRVDDDFNETYSQINLVDLAGSQGIDRTKAQKMAKFQGQNINKSILALTKVIKTMSERDQQWVNFRDSKLTRILQKSLCENSKSTVICMINPSAINYQECTNTLKFGQMAAKIRIQARKNMIRSEQQRKKQNYGEMEFLPSEKMELQEARIKLRNYEQQISYMCKVNKQLQQSNYMKQESISILESHCEHMNEQIGNWKRQNQNNRNNWWRQKKMYENREVNLKQEIQGLEKLVMDLKQKNRTLQRNEKSLVESLQHKENQCRNMTNEIYNIRNKMNEENSKSIKNSVVSSVKKSQKNDSIKQKPNPFLLPPYKESPDRLSPTKLSWIVQLKIQVIDLGRQVNEFTKANIEIAQENQQLRKKIDEYQQKSSKQRTSGKINPQALEYNQIKKLNNKIKNLKGQLKRSQEREKKHREILKKESHKNLIHMEEFEEWYTKKYTSDYFTDKEIQTDQISQRFSNQFNFSDKIDEKLPSNSKSQKGLILNNNPLIKAQNPEENLMKHSDGQDYLLSDQSKSCYDENRDININASHFESQYPRRQIDNRQKFLLENFGSKHSSKNEQIFRSFDENSFKSINNSNNIAKEKSDISASNRFKIDGSLFGSSIKNANNMIPEEQKDVQI